MELIASVDLLTLNDSEARLLSEEHNLVRAARKILGWDRSTLCSRKASTVPCCSRSPG